ncbi:MAG: permease, partial [Deltaproteobacteria bacterium]|nr:permease [Deltaproteobacteria bacterium]
FGNKEVRKKAEHIECPHCNENAPSPPPSPSRGEGEGEHIHTIAERISIGFRFAFVELLSDISRWFLIGIFIAGVISFAVPSSFIENYLGEGWLSMIIMLAVGLPLYVCAAASTPIAASLILKGMSPGAALVFLLAGPATNAASFTIIAKMLGKRTATIYLVSISVCAVLLGMILNWMYHLLGIDIHAIAGHAHAMLPIWLKWATAVPLTIVLMIAAIFKKE